MEPLLKTDLPNLYYRGKVRDTYHLGDMLLMVATDRISVFDVVLPTGIPGKGQILTHLSAFWFQRTAHLVPNHLIEVVQDVRALSAYQPGSYPPYLVGRSMVVKRAERIEIECVVRGYLAGSAWEEYRQRGSVCGIRLPPDLRQAEQLPEPIFTPATKAASGHDLNITLQEMEEHIGASLTRELVEKSLAIYRFAEAYARRRGIIIADTKLEFGLCQGQVILIDELLTPDSSRFWPLEGYAPGAAPPSFDKQYVRDWVLSLGWNREPPGPALPPEVVARTAEKYQEAYRRLTADPSGI